MKGQGGSGARMGDGNALSLYNIAAIRQDGQQQVGDAVVQQVDFVHVQHAPVCLCQQPRLKYRLALLRSPAFPLSAPNPSAALRCHLWLAAPPAPSTQHRWDRIWLPEAARQSNCAASLRAGSDLAKFIMLGTMHLRLYVRRARVGLFHPGPSSEQNTRHSPRAWVSEADDLNLPQADARTAMLQAKRKAPLEARPATLSSYCRQVSDTAGSFTGPWPSGTGAGAPSWRPRCPPCPPGGLQSPPVGSARRARSAHASAGCPPCRPAAAPARPAPGKCQPFKRLDRSSQGHEVRDVLRRQIRAPPVGPQPAPVREFAELHLKPASGIDRAALE